MKRRFGPKSISQKFLLLSMITFVLPLAFFVFFTFQNYSRTIDSKFEELAANMLGLVEKNIQYTMNDVGDTGNIILTSDAVQNVLSCDPASLGYHQETLRYEADVEELLINLTNNKKYIGSIYLGNEGYSLVKYKSLFTKMEELPFDFFDGDWIENAVEANGRGAWYADTAKTYFSEDLVLYTKLIKGLNSLQPIGVLVIGIDKQVFSDLLEPLSGLAGSEIIIWQEEGILYDSLPGESSSLFGMSAEERKSFLNSEGIQEIGFNEKVYVKSMLNRENGWIITSVIPYSVMELDKQNTLLLFCGIAALTLLVAQGCSWVFTRSITQTIRQLRSYVRALKEGRREKIAFSPRDEIGMIGNEFIRVVEENEALSMNLYKSLYREKEAELQCLQSQINPHFLYNTLDSIFWMAEEHEVPEISETVVALSRMFRLSLNNGEKIITVEKELELVENYLAIQKMRFEDKFSVEVHVPDELLQVRIIKFILQPLVENAISHGIAPKEGTGHIGIFLEEEAGDLIFTVTDDGVGFDAAQKDAVHSGYALKNIDERVKLACGESCGVTVRSERGKGTTAVVRLCRSTAGTMRSVVPAGEKENGKEDGRI